ncbi:MAG: hypothetical protein ACI865_002368 [Flavobacteriaceae bacterium]
MNSKTSNNTLKIGDVFTPITAGKFAVEQFHIFQQWFDGASVFDPTMGKGNLLEALIEVGLSKGYKLEELPTSALFGNELNTTYFKEAKTNFLEKFGLNMSSNFTNRDILDLKPKRYDILLGNPPWQNFVDLPASYKEKIKPKFFEYDLIDGKQKLLLGGSRIDIAALIIQKSIQEHLSENGRAYFFMPLSLLLNDGAHAAFRTYKIQSTTFSIDSVYDFNKHNVFQGVATRYGLVSFQRDSTPKFPLDYFIFEKSDWKKYSAQPLLHPKDPLSVLKVGAKNPLSNFEYIKLPKKSKPRQGINTCGANSIYFFTEHEEIDSDTCLVNGEYKLPTKYVQPLLTTANFKEKSVVAQKWVLLPYSDAGKPLTMEEIQKEPLLLNYLNIHRTALSSRKGILIGVWINKGQWWALMGVGAYNFMPYKVVWEAYGKNTFTPKVFKDDWQANQSLQAYIPTNTLKEAKRILKELKNPAIEAYLLSLKMEGTMNWAQPGKIKKFIQLTETK